jgi:SAM-dependent methyltransferase
MAGRTSWADRVVLDLGCGTGFHLPRFASTAARVVGVEPHPDLVALARRRTRSLSNVEVLAGTAQEIPLPDASVDVVHVRWAYFFGPGSEPGQRELARVVRRGGTALVVDNDGTRSTFGRWFSLGYPNIDADAMERFWARQGWSRTPVLTRLSFASEADLESVVRIEFDRETADAIMRERPGTEVDYAVNVWSRDF